MPNNFKKKKIKNTLLKCAIIKGLKYEVSRFKNDTSLNVVITNCDHGKKLLGSHEKHDIRLI